MEGTVGLLPQPVGAGWRRCTEIGTNTHTMFFHKTLSIVRNLGLSEEENRSVESIIRAIKRYVDGHVNETVERRNFRKCMQQTAKSFDDYLETCNFCSDACTNKNIHDQIIEGLLDADTTERN